MIYQCLFGYSEGHDLLATSFPLTREQRIHLSQLTDLSGPEPLQGFDGYLYGFPIPGGLYALSRTWYATELPRPGCVWTHALLLDQQAIAAPDVRHLARLHVRPGAQVTLNGYTAPIDDASMNEPSTESVGHQELSLILNALYSVSSRRVCVPVAASADAEAVFLIVWNQQWPALRSSFSFTTGMLGSGQWPFDLQAIPQKNRRLFQAADTFLIADSSATPTGEVVPDAAIDDAISPQPTLLRSLLWTYGKDFSAARDIFKSLCDLYDRLNAGDKHQRANSAYEYVATRFGKSPESEHLRHSLFEDGVFVDAADALGVAIRDSEGILEMSSARVRKAALTLDVASLRELTLKIIEAEGIETARLKALVDAFVERCQESMLAHLPPALVAAVLTGREDLARNPNAWRQSDDINSQVLKQLSSHGGFTAAIAFGLLRTANLRLLYEARQLRPEAWVEAIDTLVSDAPLPPDVEEFVLGLLWSARDVVRSYLQSHAVGSFVKLAGAVLDVSAREANEFPLHNFNPAAGFSELHDGGAELHACAFFVTLSLVRPEADSAIFASQSFSKVYAAAKNQQLPWGLWRGIDNQLPWNSLEWDRCARLIEGMVSRFVSCSWPAAEFVKTFRTDEEFERATRAVLHIRADSYLESLTIAVADNGTASQRERFAQLRR